MDWYWYIIMLAGGSLCIRLFLGQLHAIWNTVHTHKMFADRDINKHDLQRIIGESIMKASGKSKKGKDMDDDVAYGNMYA